MDHIQILVVEDEAIVSLDLKQRLQNLGYGVLGPVATGVEAVRWAEGWKPDLVLMDILLKGEMNGTVAAQEIKARFDIPFVYVTAHSDEATLERVKAAEPSGYVLKPFDDRELKAAIEIALHAHKMARERRDLTSAVILELDHRNAVPELPPKL